MATLIAGFHFPLNTNLPEPQLVMEAAGQSFGVGAGVHLVAGAATINANADPALLAGQTRTKAAGAASTPSRTIEVLPYRPGDKWVMNVYHATPSSAVTARAQVGEKYGLYVGASGQLYCGIDDTTATRVLVVGHYCDITVDGEAIGDVNGRVIVEFLPAYLQLAT